MPKSCSVPGCKSNYTSRDHVSTFSFPSDSVRMQQWVRAIHREDFVPTKHASVCIRHFDERFIDRVLRATRPDGTILEVPRKRPKLTEDAYPTIFENLPSYLTSAPPPKKKSPEERRNQLFEENERQYEDWCRDDTIDSFQCFLSTFKSRIGDEWIPVCKSSCVYFVLLSEECEKVCVSFKIASDLSVEVHHNGLRIPDTKFVWLLGKEKTCDKWTKFDSLIFSLLRWPWTDSTKHC